MEYTTKFGDTEVSPKTVEITTDPELMRERARRHNEVLLGHLMRAAAHGYDRLAVYSKHSTDWPATGGTYSTGSAFRMYSSGATDEHPPPPPRGYSHIGTYPVNRRPTVVHEVAERHR